MSKPIAVLGEALGLGVNGATRLLKVDAAAADDAGTAFELLAEPLPVAPAGPDGECTFLGVFLALTWTMDVSIKVTPTLDGVEQTAEAVTIDLDSIPNRRMDRKEMGLSIPHSIGGTVVGRWAMRGTWFTVRIETVGGVAAGDLLLEEIDVEYEVETESEEAVNA